MKKLGFLLTMTFLLSAVYCMSETLLVTTQIPFSFIAEGKTYPAGEYQFSENTNETAVLIRSVQPGKADGLVPVLTRLASQKQQRGSVVFDVVGNEHYLSEIHLPAMDGFLFKAAPAKHTHMIVPAGKG